MRENNILNDTSNVTDSVFTIFKKTVRAIESIFSPWVQNLMIQVLM